MVEYNANGPRAVILVATFGSLAGISVILRFVARSRTKAHYGADDWYAVGSLFTLYCWMAILILGMHKSLPHGIDTDVFMPRGAEWFWLRTCYFTTIRSDSLFEGM